MQAQSLSVADKYNEVFEYMRNAKESRFVDKDIFRILDKLSIPSKYKLKQQVPSVGSRWLVVQGKDKQFIDYMSFIKVKRSQEGVLQALMLYKAKDMHKVAPGKIIFSKEDVMQNVDAWFCVKEKWDYNEDDNADCCIMLKEEYDELQQFEIQSPQVQFLDENRAEVSYYYWNTINELVLELVEVTFDKNRHVKIEEVGNVKFFDFSCVFNVCY
ncbi:MAG: hypothetical protein PUG15_03270 [Bacteroidales bacterium]|nr:hypothetical protein [Bacteroidales bacterium]